MSKPQETTVTCPNCGATQAFTLWQSLNATLNPAEKQRLLKGELTRFTCGKCGQSTPVRYPLLYHDMEKRLMTWLWTGAGEPDVSAMPPGRFTQEYQLRFVATPNELIEKILIFDHGLDDRVVEFLKLVVHVQAGERQIPLEGELLFASVGKNSEGSESVGFVHVKPGGKESVAIPLDAYRMLAASLAPKLAAIVESNRWLRVDRNFAQALV